MKSRTAVHPNLPAPTGRLDWIGIAARIHGPVEAIESAELAPDFGIVGDRHAKKRAKPSIRQVTLMQTEHLPAVAALSGHGSIGPQNVRRNLLVSGINLLALSGRRFLVGNQVLLETTGPCLPCERMNDELGPLGMAAMQGHGGITTRIVHGGVIRVGDAVRLEPAD